MLESPSKSSQYQSRKTFEGINYEVEANGGNLKSDSKEAGSPTRVMHMRQSKINHSILQKRYREDEVVNEGESKNAGNAEQNLVANEQH